MPAPEPAKSPDRLNDLPSCREVVNLDPRPDPAPSWVARILVCEDSALQVLSEDDDLSTRIFALSGPHLGDCRPRREEDSDSSADSRADKGCYGRVGPVHEKSLGALGR